MSIEEKAKRYDELIKRLNKAREDVGGYTFKSVYDEVMSELAENEDERRIRNRIINYLKLDLKEYPAREKRINEMLAYLEKQGGQKPQRMVSAEAKEAMYNKPAWSEEDESILQGIWDEILANKHNAKEYEWKTYDKFLNWLKSLKDRVQSQNTWKPSEEMLEALYRVIPENVMEKSEDEMLLDKLYQGLKYGRVLSEK